MLFHMRTPGARQFLLIYSTPPSRPPKRGRSPVLSYLLTTHYSLPTGFPWRAAAPSFQVGLPFASLFHANGGSLLF
jgi:hypothetical protein